MSEKVIVKFTKPWRGYSPGEIAGFEESVAEALVGGGVASGYSPASATASVSTQLSEKRVKAADKKPAGRAGASKPPASSVESTSLELSQELTGVADVTAGGAPGNSGDVARELDEPHQASGINAEVDSALVVDDGDDDEKP
jgi:hypothetical protein